MGWSSTVDVKNSLRWYLGKSVQIENTWVRATLNRLRIVRHGDSSEYIGSQKLKTMVKRSIDQKLRLRNFDARHGKIETGAVVNSRKGILGVEGGKGVCYQWKEKGHCSKGDRCSSRHEAQDRAQKPDTESLHALWAIRLTRSKCVEEKKFPRQK